MRGRASSGARVMHLRNRTSPAAAFTRDAMHQLHQARWAYSAWDGVSSASASEKAA
jgi:hypothetical protein